MTIFVITVSTVLILGIVIYFNKRIKKLRDTITQQAKDFENSKDSIRKDAKKRSGAVQWGLAIENFVPFIDKFPVPAESVTFLGKPIDYIGYTDTDSKENCTVHLIEVKSGRSQLLKHQRNIKNAVLAGRVKWHEVRVKANEKV